MVVVAVGQGDHIQAADRCPGARVAPDHVGIATIEKHPLPGLFNIDGQARLAQQIAVDKRIIVGKGTVNSMLRLCAVLQENVKETPGLFARS